MRAFMTCALILAIAAIAACGSDGGGTSSSSTSNECGGCTPPPLCGEPADQCSCGCAEGQVFDLPAGSFVCQNGCLTPSQGGSGGSGSGGAGGAGGGSCSDTPLGMLCVRGEIQGNQEVLSAGGPVRFQLYPQGCYSSSCTLIHEASCAVAGVSANAFELTGKFCLEDTSPQQPGCTPDCNGGGFASCEQGGVAAGQYTVNAGSLQVSFDVPGTVPLGGACAGQPF